MTQASPRTIPTEKDLWSRFIEGVVRAAETLCPPLERTLRWDFSDCGAMFALEDECEDREAEGTIIPRTVHVRDIHQEMGDFLPHAASAA